MRTLRVLLTNNALGHHAGSETYLRDVALGLLRRGHRPVAFSLVHGAVADELRRATVPVVDDLTGLGQPPDVIHGHHHLETLIAALTFPGVPIVHFCHGWSPWEEKPLRHPSIRRYVAVDEVCADRLMHQEGIESERVELLLNFVDLSRFRPRDPLPARPRRALVFSNQATSDGYVRHIAAACASHGVELDIVGIAAGNQVPTPELLLQKYDLVFAKARAALEAMAMGCAVAIADAFGCGPLVTLANYPRLRARNFGVRELQQPHGAEWYSKVLAAYDPGEAAAVRDRVRADADLEPAIDRILGLYRGAIETPAGTDGAQQAAARHLYHIVRPFKAAWSLDSRLQVSEQNVHLARTERDENAIGRRRAEEARDENALGRRRAEEERDEIALERRRAEEARDRLENEHAALQQQLSGARQRLAQLETTLQALETSQRTIEDQRIERLRQLETALSCSENRADALSREVTEYRKEVTEYRSLTILRLRDAILRLPILGPTAHGAARLLVRGRK